MPKNRIITIILITVIAFGLLSCAQEKPQATTQKAGATLKAPDFTLKDLDGNPFKLSDTAGKVVILDFFATWCPPCQAEIPHFQAMIRRLPLASTSGVTTSTLIFTAIQTCPKSTEAG